MSGNRTARFDKERLPSRHVTEGTINALQRVFLYAMGLDTEAIHQPLIGVASAWNGAAPAGETPLRVADAAQAGVWAGGATPRRFATVADLGDGTDHPLVVRELVADSLELTVRGHSYDAVLGVAACPGSIAGLMLGMVRLDIPGTIVALTAPELGSSEDAYALAAMAEMLGLATSRQPGAADDARAAGAIGAVGRRPGGEGDGAGGAEERARQAGRALTDLLAQGVSARRFVTPDSLRAAAVLAGALGASPGVLIDLVAIGREAGVDVALSGLGEAMADAPRLWPSPSAALARWSVPALLPPLVERSALDPDALPDVGHEPGGEIDDAAAARAVAAAPESAWVTGSLAPEGALVSHPHDAPAQTGGAAAVFDDEDAACRWIMRGWAPNVVLVVRGRGPAGGPGMPALDGLARAIETAGPPPGAVLVTDGLCRPIAGVTCVTAAGPEAAAGGPLAIVRDGDAINLDLDAARLDADLDPAGERVPVARGEERAPPLTGVLHKYAATVAPAASGATTHPGARGEVVRYAAL